MWEWGSVYKIKLLGIENEMFRFVHKSHVCQPPSFMGVWLKAVGIISKNKILLLEIEIYFQFCTEDSFLEWGNSPKNFC